MFVLGAVFVLDEFRIKTTRCSGFCSFCSPKWRRSPVASELLMCAEGEKPFLL